MLHYTVGINSVAVTTWAFPAGEVGVKINCGERQPHDPHDDITVYASLRNSTEVMELLMAADALKRRYPGRKIIARLPFIPYARQDRVCADGESLSAAVIARLINSCGFAEVWTVDPHSDVLPALIDNVQVRTQADLFRYNVKGVGGRNVVIAPDAGAVKKSKAVANVLGISEIAQAYKTRNMETGEITEYAFHGDVEGKHVLVVDDLIDGGYTFLRLGEKLKEAGVASATLFASHGIFTKGVDALKEMYNTIITTNSYHCDRRGLVDGVRYIDVY